MGQQNSLPKTRETKSRAAKFWIFGLIDIINNFQIVRDGSCHCNGVGRQLRKLANLHVWEMMGWKTKVKHEFRGRKSKIWNYLLGWVYQFLPKMENFFSFHYSLNSELETFQDLQKCFNLLNHPNSLKNKTLTIIIRIRWIWPEFGNEPNSGHKLYSLQSKARREKMGLFQQFSDITSSDGDYPMMNIAPSWPISLT